MSSTTANLASAPHGPLESPPPYTPRADPLQGETAVEYGPSGPFQQAPTQSSQPRSSVRQVQSTVDERARGDLERAADGWAGTSTGTTNQFHISSTSPQSGALYPGQLTDIPSTYIHETSFSTGSTTSSSAHRSPTSPAMTPGGSSDFARDFYAAGTGQGLFSESEGHQPPPPSRQASQNRAPPQRTPEDRRPTTTPVPGRPLLHAGQLLVYPRGYSCDKCYNTGYKYYDPTRPCKRCWSKYGKPFSGPLAYSYSSSPATSNTQNINLQKPLPHRTAVPPQRQVPSVSPHFESSNFGYYQPMPPHNFYTQGPSVTAISGMLSPPPGATVYTPGDPRIGGDICWRCNGKGTMSIFIDIINCPICGGCGRTFI
ncbi:hypothetical protein P691DRAFT_736781 [Macrolepiota fuliginosa MF-IS2]|uniref:Uncharacterized protein n=1 Tax=Macrolepiota fuliginosa MF-IS2 TaxID=1400762 RepID=A0A9P5X7L4_9AGAR|nr:hypothetical protein P691DRAFT_736781 [Macrolepiota fuliginosa MF-IS2]